MRTLVDQLLTVCCRANNGVPEVFKQPDKGLANVRLVLGDGDPDGV
jgi:hypothetical protein